MILDLLTVTEYTPKMFHEQWHEEYGISEFHIV